MNAPRAALPQLRAWQVEALDVWLRSKSGIVAVVTGGGKTVFALEAIRRCLLDSPRLKVMVLVPTVALQDQWLEEFTAIAEPGQISTRWSGEASTESFFVLVNDTARNVVPTIDEQSRWIQVVDECHRAASPENRRALMPGATARLGLSATPERQYDDLFQTVLLPALGPIIYRYTYTDALRDGVICQFDLNNYRVPTSTTEDAEISRLSRQVAHEASRPSRDEQKLTALLMRRARLVQNVRAREPVAVALAASQASSRSSIVFHESTKAADRIAAALRARNVPTSIYHSGLRPEVRRRDLHLFRLGATSVMVCCRALDEGLNVPRAKFAVVAASTATTRQRIQRLGRMLRPDSQRARAEIATLYATNDEAERLRQESVDLEGLVDVHWFSARVGIPDVLD